MSFDPREAWALDQDAHDPLAGYRKEFDYPVGRRGEPLTYLCGNSLGLMPTATRGMLNQELDDWSRLAVEGHMEAKRPWFSYHELFRESGARLVGATPGEVVMMNSLSVNLQLMMVTFYRPAGPRVKVLIEDAAFPSDRYAVMSHLGARGVDPDAHLIIATPRPGELTLRTDDLAALIERHGSELALVLLPGVQYYTGQRLDLERLTQAAHGVGAIAGFDLAHAAGNVPLALHDWNADFAVWCSYKYLNGGPGAVGGCFVHERHGLDLTIPRFAGWWGNDPGSRFRLHLNERFVPREGADGWQISNPPVFSMTPLLASLRLFDGAGMEAIRAKSVRLTGYLEYLIGRLATDRLRIITPSDPDARGCQLSLLVSGGARSTFDQLRARGVVGDFRQPDVIRLSPAPLYNTFHEVWRAAHHLSEVLAG